jgi:hypothetical protein
MGWYPDYFAYYTALGLGEPKSEPPSLLTVNSRTPSYTVLPFLELRGPECETGSARGSAHA